jgi:hypothetical protein
LDKLPVASGLLEKKKREEGVERRKRERNLPLKGK